MGLQVQQQGGPDLHGGSRGGEESAGGPGKGGLLGVVCLLQGGRRNTGGWGLGMSRPAWGGAWGGWAAAEAAGRALRQWRCCCQCGSVVPCCAAPVDRAGCGCRACCLQFRDRSLPTAQFPAALEEQVCCAIHHSLLRTDELVGSIYDSLRPNGTQQQQQQLDQAVAAQQQHKGKQEEEQGEQQVSVLAAKENGGAHEQQQQQRVGAGGAADSAATTQKGEAGEAAAVDAGQAELTAQKPGGDASGVQGPPAAKKPKGPKAPISRPLLRTFLLENAQQEGPEHATKLVWVVRQELRQRYSLPEAVPPQIHQQLEASVRVPKAKGSGKGGSKEGQGKQEQKEGKAGGKEGGGGSKEASKAGGKVQEAKTGGAFLLPVALINLQSCDQAASAVLCVDCYARRCSHRWPLALCSISWWPDCWCPAPGCAVLLAQRVAGCVCPVASADGRLLVPWLPLLLPLLLQRAAQCPSCPPGPSPSPRRRASSSRLRLGKSRAAAAERRLPR